MAFAFYVVGVADPAPDSTLLLLGERRIPVVWFPDESFEQAEKRSAWKLLSVELKGAVFQGHANLPDRLRSDPKPYLNGYQEWCVP